MRRLTIFLLGILLSICSMAQQETELIAPVSQDFSNALNNKNQGFIPSPMVYTFDNQSYLRSAISLPAKYDMRDLGILTTPRNQSGSNTCWSFATMDVLQSVWARMGINPGYMSPENLANCHGFQLLKNDGGTADMAIAYLSRFAGPVYEASDPYVAASTGTCKTIGKSDKVSIIGEALHLPKNTQVIKEMIYRYGGVFTGVSAAGFSASYYNSTTNCTYSPDAASGTLNHAGTIVGWDDNKVVTIPGKTSPSAAGAWIIKNTYGTSLNDAGYYYASYEDYFVGSSAVVYPQRIEKDNIDTVYFYDKLGSITSVGWFKDSAYTLVKYTAPTTQIINAIGYYTRSYGSTLDIAIYQTKSGETLSGLLYSKSGVYAEYPGYHTLPVSANVIGSFYVYIKYKTPKNNTPVCIENYKSGYSNPTIRPDTVQWIKYSDSSNWNVVGGASTRTYNLCLKVYAKNSSSVPSFVVNKTKTCGNDTLIFTNTSQGSYTSYLWNFGDGATPQSATTTSIGQTVKVVYSTTGLKNLKLIATLGAQKDSVVKNGAVEILAGVPLKIYSPSDTYSTLKNTKLILVGVGADSYSWSASTIPSTIGNKVLVRVPETGVLVKVLGTLGKCTATDSASLGILPNTASYDDIQDAKALTLDVTEGPFTNLNATWQTNEPIPSATGCTLQNGWCPGQNSLENTLWFTFLAPSTGAVKIVTKGIDNQIALYDAKSTGTYADILSGDISKYAILAANDDSSATTQAAATIEKVTGLTPNKIYWIQLDGSLGGVTGNSYITVKTELASGINSPIAKSYYLVNPLQNKTLIINSAKDIRQLTIYDLVGKFIKRQSFKDQSSIHLGLDYLKWGYYLIKIETNQGVYTEKILVE